MVERASRTATESVRDLASTMKTSPERILLLLRAAALPPHQRERCRHQGTKGHLASLRTVSKCRCRNSRSGRIGIGSQQLVRRPPRPRDAPRCQAHLPRVLPRRAHQTSPSRPRGARCLSSVLHLSCVESNMRNLPSPFQSRVSPKPRSQTGALTRTPRWQCAVRSNEFARKKRAESAP